MRTVLLLALGFAASTVDAGALTPRMSGERLLKQLEPVEAGAIAEAAGKFSKDELASLRTMRNVEFVQGYLAAVFDQTEGTAWCYDPKSKTPKPDTLWDESRWALHRFSATQLKRNAAELLTEIWREKWPCSSGGARGRQ